MWRRSKVREAKEEERQAAAEVAAAAAVVTDTTITDGKQQPDQIEQCNPRRGCKSEAVWLHQHVQSGSYLLLSGVL